MTDELITLLQAAAQHTEPLLSQIHGPALRLPTPCAGMDAGTVAGHLIGGIRGFVEVARGGALRFDADPDVEREDAWAAFKAATAELLDAFDGPALDTTYDMPWGPTTGRQLMGFELIEITVHGWDLARALGQGGTIPDVLAGATLAGARMWVDDSVRVPQMFGPEVPVAADAPLTDQLVAFLGRDPGWAPG